MKNVTEIQTAGQLPDFTEIKKISDNLKKEFTKKPNPKNIKVNKFANNSKYLTIGYIEAILDRHFLTWDVYVTDVQLMLNAVVVTVRVEMTTIAGSKITRMGVGASEIQTRKGSTTLDPGTISPKALEKNVPIAKSMAIKNAVASLGDAFGRNLNREYNFEHIPDENLLKNIFGE